MSDEPIPGLIYNLTDFIFDYGHLIVPGSARIEPHPRKLGQIIMVVGTREEAEGGSSQDEQEA